MFTWSESAWLSFFLELAWKSAVVLTAAWIVAMGLRKSSAAARHLVWASGLAAAAVLPLIAIVGPSIRIPVAPSALVFRVSNGFDAAVSAPAPQPSSPARILPRRRKLMPCRVWIGGWL
jgi:bla regulator protein blaR1